MQLILSELSFRLVQPDDVCFQVFAPFLWKMVGLGLLFLLLGLWLAKLCFGSSDNRLTKVRLEIFQLINQTNQIVDEQNLQINKLKKSAAVYQADLNYRDTKIEKLTKERVKMQGDLNEKIKAEMEYSKSFSEKDSLILELRKDLAQKEGIYARLGELEAVIDERDREINQLRLEIAEKAQGGSNEAMEKISSLEQLLSNRDDELSRLRADRDKIRQDLEITLRNRENKIMDLEDSLGERESMIVALEAELMEHHKNGKKFYDFENLIAERDLEIEELKKLGSTKGELQNELNKVRGDLHKRESEIQNIKKQYHEAKQQRETKLQEAQAQIEAQNGELKSLRALQSIADKTKARLTDLESMLEERDQKIEQLNSLHHDQTRLENLIEEKDAALHQAQTHQEGLDQKIRELESLVTEKASQLAGMDELKASQEGSVSRIQELEWLLGEKSANLEKVLAERDGEIERLIKDKQELGHLLRIKESDMEAMRQERLPYDTIQHHISDLERVLLDRDRELQRFKAERDEELIRLKRENADLITQLRYSESELKRIRIDRQSPDSGYPRNGEIRIARASIEKPSIRVEPVRVEPSARIERDPAEDILARLRELERMVTERDREARPLRAHEKSEFRFTLEDGSATYLRANETIEFEGKILRAEDLYYLLRDREKG